MYVTTQGPQLKVPKDFIVNRNNVTEGQMTHRYAIARELDDKVTTQDVEETNYEVRAFVLRTADTLVDEYFTERFNQRYPNFVPGRTLTCMADFVEWHATLPFDMKMAEAAQYAMITVWGKNKYALTMETELKRRLGIVYTGLVCNLEDLKKHKFPGGSLHDLCVTVKNRKSEPIRRNGRMIHKEYPCSRTAKDNQKFSCKLPRPVGKLARCVEIHGYRGHVRICEGHSEAGQFIKETSDPQENSETEDSEHEDHRATAYGADVPHPAPTNAAAADGADAPHPAPTNAATADGADAPHPGPMDAATASQPGPAGAENSTLLSPENFAMVKKALEDAGMNISMIPSLVSPSTPDSLYDSDSSDRMAEWAPKLYSDDADDDRENQESNDVDDDRENQESNSVSTIE